MSAAWQGNVAAPLLQRFKVSHSCYYILLENCCTVPYHSNKCAQRSDGFTTHFQLLLHFVYLLTEYFLTCKLYQVYCIHIVLVIVKYL